MNPWYQVEECHTYNGARLNSRSSGQHTGEDSGGGVNARDRGTRLFVRQRASGYIQVIHIYQRAVDLLLER